MASEVSETNLRLCINRCHLNKFRGFKETQNGGFCSELDKFFNKISF